MHTWIRFVSWFVIVAAKSREKWRGNGGGKRVAARSHSHRSHIVSQLVQEHDTPRRSLLYSLRVCRDAIPTIRCVQREVAGGRDAAQYVLEEGAMRARYAREIKLRGARVKLRGPPFRWCDQRRNSRDKRSSLKICSMMLGIRDVGVSSFPSRSREWVIDSVGKIYCSAELIRRWILRQIVICRTDRKPGVVYLMITMYFI